VNDTARWLLVAALGLAVGDWIAVGAGNRRAEYLFKPATMLPLIAAALVLEPADETMRVFFVVALCLSLLGDVFLMLPDQDRFFVPGLGSFLLAHVAYIAGLLAGGVSGVALALGVLLVAVAILTVAPRVVNGARSMDPRLGVPVLAYVLVISVMVASAVGSVVPAAIGGAVLFYLSDLAIGWSRFVREFPASRLVIITTYHTAQVLLTVSLVVDR
jgi:uncharacterized membrane protein YhhN